MSTTFQVMYRNVPVPEFILAPGFFGTRLLDAFKAGVDGALDQETSPEPTDDGWDYYTDEEDPNDPMAYFRRFRKGEDKNGQFLSNERTEHWSYDFSADRAHAEKYYRPISFADVPDHVRTRPVTVSEFRYFTNEQPGVDKTFWRMPARRANLRGEIWSDVDRAWGPSACMTRNFFEDDACWVVLPGYQEIDELDLPAAARG